MNLLTIIIIAIGLAMDAFAVSVVSGAASKQFQVKHALRMAFFFGAFQAIMPVVGWLAGRTIHGFIDNYDHWVAFGLLSCIGCKMIYESFKITKIEKSFGPESILLLVGLSVATSLDALAVGISLAFFVEKIWGVVIIIGVVTLILSYIGVYVGQKLGHFFENRIEVLGGIILIGIGVKILFESLV